MTERFHFTAAVACYSCTCCGQTRPPAPDQRFANCLISDDGVHVYRLTFVPTPPNTLLWALGSLLSFKTNERRAVAKPPPALEPPEPPCDL